MFARILGHPFCYSFVTFPECPVKALPADQWEILAVSVCVELTSVAVAFYYMISVIALLHVAISLICF